MLEQLNNIASGNVKWCNHLKKIYQLLKTLHIHIPQNLAINFRYLPKGIKHVSIQEFVLNLSQQLCL